MHSNADITYQRNVSNTLCEVILLTFSDEGGEDSGSDTDKVVNDILSRMLDGLPELLKRVDASKAVKERGSDGMISIYTTFLFHEMEKFSKLLVRMRESMTNLQDAIKGIALMSNELDTMFNALIINQVPPNWKKLSFLSLKPLSSWNEDLIKRVE